MKGDRSATALLHELSRGETAAADKLVPLLYEELKALADRFLRSEKRGHPLQSTALVHEAYLRLVDQRNIDENGRTHFMGVAANVMRRVLVDHARAMGRKKRGGDWRRVTVDVEELRENGPDVDAADVSEMLDKLAAIDERQARIVELRFFGGLTVPEIAQLLGLSESTVNKDWRMARAWILSHLQQDGPP